MPRRTGKQGLHTRIRQGERLKLLRDRARRAAQDRKEADLGHYSHVTEETPEASSFFQEELDSEEDQEHT